ncbi:hypothetical protein BU16DRAFT_563623 [Lophium mytilinum]|uniref:Uncharacterized protein n=1 Tax=Lophium mytilinum TaxID=390894 RepID=A0A6A6QMW1_9PEZI|nr:hypothetical protein BU16DRAFT_563623 [Lophium mytilinum]
MAPLTRVNASKCTLLPTTLPHLFGAAETFDSGTSTTKRQLFPSTTCSQNTGSFTNKPVAKAFRANITPSPKMPAHVFHRSIDELAVQEGQRAPCAASSQLFPIYRQPFRIMDLPQELIDKILVFAVGGIVQPIARGKNAFRGRCARGMGKSGEKYEIAFQPPSVSLLMVRKYFFRVVKEQIWWQHTWKHFSKATDFLPFVASTMNRSQLNGIILPTLSDSYQFKALQRIHLNLRTAAYLEFFAVPLRPFSDPSWQGEMWGAACILGDIPCIKTLEFSFELSYLDSIRAKRGPWCEHCIEPLWNEDDTSEAWAWLSDMDMRLGLNFDHRLREIVIDWIISHAYGADYLDWIEEVKILISEDIEASYIERWDTMEETRRQNGKVFPIGQINLSQLKGAREWEDFN